MSGYPFRLADPDDQGRAPVPPGPANRISIPVRRLMAGAGSRRRLAVVDSHFPWVVSGFRYHEGEELLRQRPDTLFFSLYRMTDPFPTRVSTCRVSDTSPCSWGNGRIHGVFNREQEFSASLVPMGSPG